MSKESKHPPLPYQHHLDKKCSVEGCQELGYLVWCGICNQRKRKTLCERHLMVRKENNRALRGKLTAGIELQDIKYYSRPHANTPKN